MIDDEDRLVQADSGFYSFAEKNGWDGAGASLGRSIWDFVAGEEMKKLQRLLLSRVRGEAGGVELTFRCDGPRARREMDIRITPTSSRRLVLFETRLRSEMPRQFQSLIDPTSARDEETVEMCGWCDRFFVSEEWVEVEEAAARLGLFRRSALPEVTHGICPDCSEMLRGA